MIYCRKKQRYKSARLYDIELKIIGCNDFGSHIFLSLIPRCTHNLTHNKISETA